MKRKETSKILALLLSLCLLLPCFALGASAAKPAYTIGNPYASVNWDTWKQYKTQLHCHTNASDGDIPLNEQVEEHYSLGYDILCITDHMSLGVPWNEIPRTMPLMRLVKYERTKMAPIAPLTDQRREEILAGVGRGGRGMLEITQGVELNGAVPSNSHLQGFFCDFGQGKIGVDYDWETPVKKAQAAGGLTVIDHPGFATKADYSDDPMNFYDDNPKWVNKFARLFVEYPSCVGIDINSMEDNHTHYDRILYDRILAKTIPYGVVPWAFCFSDGHYAGQFDRAWTVHLMPEKTPAALRASMEAGTFFGVARFARLEAGDDFEGVGAPPAVKHIAVDQAKGTITITASKYDSITWVSDGEVIATGKTLKLAGYDAKVGSYIRAYLLGPGGILYVQPFTVLRAGQTLEKEKIPQIFDSSVPLRFLSDTMEFVMKIFPPLRWLWRLLTWFDPAVDLPGLMKLVGYTA